MCLLAVKRLVVVGGASEEGRKVGRGKEAGGVCEVAAAGGSGPNQLVVVAAGGRFEVGGWWGEVWTGPGAKAGKSRIDPVRGPSRPGT